MKLSVETVGQLWASGRHYISMGAGLVTGIGLMSAAENKGLMEAVGQIYDGVALVVTGATSAWQILLAAFPIVGIAMAKIASRSASTNNQAAAVKAAVADPVTPVSTEAKAAVLEAALALPEVPNNQTIKVNDPVLANITSTNVVLAR